MTRESNVERERLYITYKDIAKAAGFNANSRSVQYHIRALRKMLGMTQYDYRSRIKRENVCVK